MGPPPSHLTGTRGFVENYGAIMEQTQYRNSSYDIIIAIGVTLLIFGTLLICFWKGIGAPSGPDQKKGKRRCRTWGPATGAMERRCGST